MSGRIKGLRNAYYRQICDKVLRQNESGVPNNADSGSAASVRIGRGIIDLIGFPVKTERLAGQTAGHRFEEVTKDFLRDAFGLLAHLRPGEWEFSLGGNIGDYGQYQHLSYVLRRIDENDVLLGKGEIATHTPLRSANSQADILYASVSCKWTIRSDRSQNARTEGLNLMHNRKERTPHIVVVVGEPLPGRIASLAYGTGDIDCIYHFTLRDISDLPFDWAI